MTAVIPKKYTADEYLALEVQSDTRNGEIVPMTSGTPIHNEIIATLVFLLKAGLRQQPYSIFVTDQRLWIPKLDQYTYPEVMITMRPPELKSGRKDTVINPILIMEVLSEATERYDRGDKFKAYRTIPTFQEYLLIAQDRVQIEQYVKQSNCEWIFREYVSLSDSVELRSVGINLSLAEVYEAVEF